MRKSKTVNRTRVDTEFRHEPIKFYRDIRLLFVAPQQNHTSDIWCSTYQVSFKEKPPYEALSYAWGDPEPSQHIICDGKKLAVTRNLYSALFRLRQSHALQPLWIDAICIDQDNTKERNKQVRLMKQIYENSKRVVIWLGEEVESDKDAFDALYSLNRFLLDFDKDQRNWGLRQGIDSFGDTLQHLNLQSPGFRALDILFQRPWFMRAWIVQEVVLPPDAHVTCGNLTIPWKIISRVISTFARRGLLLQLGHTVFSNPESFWRVDAIALLQASVSSAGAPLLNLLIRNRLCSATDPRDKVFSFIGLASDSATMGILPDYSLKTTEVYQKVAIQLAKAHGLSIVLSLAGDTNFLTKPPLYSELPSWVPDWSHRAAKPPMYMNFRAGGPTVEKYALDDVQKALTVQGKFIDRVAHVNELSDRPQGIERNHKEVQMYNAKELASWEELASNLKSYPTGETVEDALWRTLILNHTIDGSVAPQHFKKYFEAFRTFIKKSVGQATTPLLVHHGEEERAHEAMAYRFAETASQCQACMHLCTTQNGFLGCAPITVQKGDIICVFLGSHVPFILRAHENSGSYRLISECYIHGIMQGEAMHAANVPVQGITIR